MSKTRRENISKAKKKSFRKNPDAKKLMSQIRIEFFRNPAERKKASENIKKVYQERPEIKHKISLSLKKYWNKNPEAKIEMSRIKKQQYKSNPELRNKIDRIVTAWWKAHPAERKKKADRIKKWFIENPDAFKEFMKHGKNPLKKHLKTSQGFLVRSKGEQQIANFLYKNKIPCLYESIDLMITTPPFKGNICNPDFYIPSYNIFIEFYGGYPTAWKKKVLKNKIYKAHRIPVLGITPAELEDLDYYLLKQGEKLAKSEMARRFKIHKWIR